MAGEAVPLAGLDGPHVATTSGQEEIDLQLSDASEQGSASAPQKSNSSSVKETKVIYHIDEEETPYLVKIVIFFSLINHKTFLYFFLWS